MNDDMSRLIAIAPPPSAPVDAGSPIGWIEVERRLDTSLPADYKWLINTYGSGRFNDLFYVFNPFALSVVAEGSNLLKQAFNEVRNYSSHLELYEETRQVFPEYCPYPSFPA